MKKQLNKMFMTLVSASVFAAVLFLGVEQDESGQWKMTVSSSMASGTEDGGTEDGGTEDGGGGTLTCSQRGGSEMPSKVLQVGTCLIQISAGYPGGVTYIQGSKCKCKNPPSGYQGEKGCNLSWETNCKKA